MKNLSLRKHHLYIEVGLFVIGILALFFLHDPYKYSGIAFFIAALGFYFFWSIYRPLDGHNNKNTRSRIRDQMLKHQYKAK